MTWADVQALRKSGRFQEAIDIGLRDLANDPDDFKLRTQIDWAFYGLVKTLVSTVGAKLKASQPVPVQTISQIHMNFADSQNSRNVAQTMRSLTSFERCAKLHRISKPFQGSFGGLVPMV